MGSSVNLQMLLYALPPALIFFLGMDLTSRGNEVNDWFFGALSLATALALMVVCARTARTLNAATRNDINNETLMEATACALYGALNKDGDIRRVTSEAMHKKLKLRMLPADNPERVLRDDSTPAEMHDLVQLVLALFHAVIEDNVRQCLLATAALKAKERSARNLADIVGAMASALDIRPEKRGTAILTKHGLQRNPSDATKLMTDEGTEPDASLSYQALSSFFQELVEIWKLGIVRINTLPLDAAHIRLINAARGVCELSLHGVPDRGTPAWDAFINALNTLQHANVICKRVVICETPADAARVPDGQAVQ